MLAAPTAYAVLQAGVFREELAALGFLSCLVLAAGLVFRVRWLVPASMIAAAATYEISLVVEERSIDAGALLVGAALLLTGELAEWSEEPRAMHTERHLVVARALALIGLAGGGAAAAAVLLAAASVAVGRDQAVLEPLGVAAAVAAVALVAWLGHERAREHA